MQHKQSGIVNYLSKFILSFSFFCFKPIFEQLWASEDYEIFKRMMIQKNVELELQALELVRKRQGILICSQFTLNYTS